MATVTPEIGEAGLLVGGGLVPIHQPLSYTPNVGESALLVNGAVMPLRPSYLPAPADLETPRLVVEEANRSLFPYQRYMDHHPTNDSAGDCGLTSAAPSVDHTHTVCILDTTLTPTTEELENPHFRPNPGLSMLSLAHLFYPTADPEATPLGYDVAGFEWLASAAWTKTGESTGTLALSIANALAGMEIKYTAGSGEPDTVYTTPIAITATGTIRFRLYNGTRTGPIYTHHVTFTAGVAPESASAKHPIITLSTDPGGTTLNGSANHPDVHYRYRYSSAGATTPKPETLDSAASGTQYLAPFLPIDEVSGTTRSGTLSMVAYKYGLTYSVNSTPVEVKIGKLSASWDGIDALTLTCATTSATIKYRLNGTGAFLTYSAPLTITETTAVEFYAEKTGLLSSDIFAFEITYTTDETPLPPEAWADSWWSDYTTGSLGAARDYAGNWNPAVSRVVIYFPERPDYYITPTGTGDGLTPSTPSNMATVIGINGTPGTASSGDVVWASEGTYTPTTLAGYWKLNAGVVLMGGYSTDFTKRDVLNRKSIVSPFVVETDQEVLDTDDTLLYTFTQIEVSECTIDGGTTGVVDGFWSEGQNAQWRIYIEYAYDPILDEDYIVKNAIQPYWQSSPIHFRGNRFYNCHVAYSVARTGQETQHEFWHGFDFSQITEFRAYSMTGTNPKCYGCTLDVSITTDDGLDGISDDFDATEGYVYRLSAADGDGRSVTVQGFYGVGGSDVEVKFCDVDVVLSVGRGGDGGDTYAYTDESSIRPMPELSIAGHGGQSTGWVSIGAASGLPAIGMNNTLDVSVTVGGAGNGGDASAIVGDPDPASWADELDTTTYAGSGGMTIGSVGATGFGGGASTTNIDVIVGNGSNGGSVFSNANEGYNIPADFYRWPGGLLAGWVEASAGTNSHGRYDTETISCVCGDAGNTGTFTNENVFYPGTPLPPGEYIANRLYKRNPSASISTNTGHVSANPVYGLRYQCEHSYYVQTGACGDGIDIDLEDPDTPDWAWLGYTFRCWIRSDAPYYPATFTAETAVTDLPTTPTLDQWYHGIQVNPDAETAQLDSARHLSTITITEAAVATRSGGNYDRVNSTISSDEGVTYAGDFFTGTNDGPNAPIDDYDAGGSGTTYGRFWDTA